MERSSLQKVATRTRHGDSLAQTKSAKPDDWKHKLNSKLRTTKHERTPEFDNLLSIYIATDAAENAKLDVSLLICGCMEHEEVEMLWHILKYEDIKSLCIEGPIDARGWKALVKAMPDALHVTELTVSKEHFDVDKCKLLFKVLKHMHVLEKVSLRKVAEARGMLFDQLECPDLPKLVELDVFAKSDSNAGGGRLPLKILRACQVRRLSIEDSGGISVDKHSKLADLLRKQTRMESLRLRIERRETPEEFACYMQFLCGKTSLVHLDLNGCCIQVHNFNQLVEALSQNQPTLQSLLLSDCGVAGNRKYKETVRINLLPLAGMNSLTHLDLSKNRLPWRPTLSLLEELQVSPNRLEILDLSGNMIARKTYSAMASFLRGSHTLRSLSFQPSTSQGYLHDDVEVLDELVGAMEQNKCLLELEFHWTWLPDEHRASIDTYLDRNRNAFKQASIQAAMQAAAASAMPLLLNTPWPWEIRQRPQLPGDMIQHIIGQGLTESDAVNLSSINKEAWASRQEFLRKAGS